LESLGFSIEIATNGVEAVKKCTHHEYSAVLMDCQMPLMDGLEATRRIRALNRRAVPIIALTAGAGHMERELAINAGMDDFLCKPISRYDLQITLARWLGTNQGETRTVDRTDPQFDFRVDDAKAFQNGEAMHVS